MRTIWPGLTGRWLQEFFLPGAQARNQSQINDGARQFVPPVSKQPPPPSRILPPQDLTTPVVILYLAGLATPAVIGYQRRDHQR